MDPPASQSIDSVGAPLQDQSARLKTLELENHRLRKEKEKEEEAHRLTKAEFNLLKRLYDEERERATNAGVDRSRGTNNNNANDVGDQDESTRP